ncbi:inositol monophosphatase 3-like [Haliotis rufescens]|uniref:inositol monophosphatase 3-like n=1 Tax=Haliotis rufescens TaxID=6454 RepID=UPI001EB02F01|nr:inositol monophosphatase 3-like [Haliotis rufescens]
MAPVNVRLNPVGLAVGVAVIISIFFYIFGLPGLFRQEQRISMKEILSVSVELARRGGSRVKSIVEAKNGLEAQVKGKTKEGAKEMLTQGDLQSHKAIFYGFEKAFPGLRVLSEEHDTEPVDLNTIPSVNKELEEVMDIVLSDQSIPMNSIAIWIDPLDATQEYTEALYQYVTTMVCVVVNGEPRIGVIHRPFSDETVWAWVGYGHSTNLKKAENVKYDTKKKKIIVSRSHKGTVEDVAREAFGEDTEVIGAGGAGYKVLEVIKGNVNAYTHVTLIKKWDICAGNAIISAMDGKMTTLEGNIIDYSPFNDYKNDKGLLATLYDHFDYLEKLAPAVEKYKKNTVKKTIEKKPHESKDDEKRPSR